MKIVLTILIVLVVGGCAMLSTPVTEKVFAVIDKYCEEPYGQRQVYRETVNRKLLAEGHTIVVTCASDPHDETD